MVELAALCTLAKSVYDRFPFVDCYDKRRDATTFAGGMAVVAHPPCRLWGNLRHNVRISCSDELKERELGLFCANAVCENGGVLEHPFGSNLFEAAGLPAGGMANERGFTIELPQRIFGHTMIKNSWFFIAGLEWRDVPPVRPLLHRQPLKLISDLSQRQRMATPPALAAWLVDIARMAG